MTRSVMPGIVNESNVSNAMETSEIPDNVTAELEKLEQEEGPPMVEAESVSAILGDLGEDDDELLGKIALFNVERRSVTMRLWSTSS